MDMVMDAFLDMASVLAATFVGMVLGAFWYSPLLFGNQWMQSLGKTKETLGSATGPMIGSVIASLMTALGVFVIQGFVGVDSFTQSAMIGLVLGVLIIFPAFLSDNLFCGWGMPLLLIQSGYRMLSVFLMSVVIYSVRG